MLTFSYRNKKESTVLGRIIRIEEKIFGLNPVRAFVAMSVFMETSQVALFALINMRDSGAPRRCSGAPGKWSYSLLIAVISQAGDTPSDFRSVF